VNLLERVISVLMHLAAETFQLQSDWLREFGGSGPATIYSHGQQDDEIAEETHAGTMSLAAVAVNRNRGGQGGEPAGLFHF